MNHAGTRPREQEAHGLEGETTRSVQGEEASAACSGVSGEKGRQAKSHGAW